MIRELTTDKLHKQIDLSGAKPGTHTELLTPNSLNFPAALSLPGSGPAPFPIDLDQALIRRMEVQPVIKGYLPGL